MSKQLTVAKFLPDGSDGFQIQRVRDSFIEGKYIEKLLFEESVRDPFGLEYAYERTEYREVQFVFFDKYPQIEIVESPRGLKSFINKVAEITGFTVAVEPLLISPLVWADNLERDHSGTMVVKALQVSGVEIDAGAIARVSANGPSDIRSVLQNFLGKRSFVVDRVQLAFNRGGSVETIVLSSDATARSFAIISDELRNHLRQSLPQTH